MAYGSVTMFTPSFFSNISGGTVTENVDNGGVTFTPSSKLSYIEFQINCPVIKINLTKSINGEFYVILNSRKVALKYRYTASLEQENAIYIRTNGFSTVRIQATMTGIDDYSIDLVSYQVTDVNPFVVGDLIDWKESLISKYFNSGFRITNIYYARALCSLYERGWKDASVLAEIKRIADNSLLSVNSVNKRLSNAGVFANGVALHFLYMVYQITKDDKYKIPCIDFIEYNLIQSNWKKSSKYPTVYQTTDGYDSITFNHNYFLGEALIHVGRAESNAIYTQIGLDQFMGTSQAIDAKGMRAHGSDVNYQYRNYKYQEAFQNLRTGYLLNNSTLIEDGKKLLRYAETMNDEAPNDWIIQNRILNTDGVFYEVFHENVSCVALPYYYMVKNDDYDYGWHDAKKYVENAFTLFDKDLGQFWFSRNYHTDYYTPGTFHSLCWYLESGMYDDLQVDKISGIVTFGALEPPEVIIERDIWKIRVQGKFGRVYEASLVNEKESEQSVAVNTVFGIKYINLLDITDPNASEIRIFTKSGIKAFSKLI